MLLLQKGMYLFIFGTKNATFKGVSLFLMMTMMMMMMLINDDDDERVMMMIMMMMKG